MKLKTIDPALAHATWFWDHFGEVGHLETYLPPRNTHGGLFIEADCAEYETFGTWQVKENNRIVAEGRVLRKNGEWQNGRSPQLRAERVICYGVENVMERAS